MSATWSQVPRQQPATQSAREGIPEGSRVPVQGSGFEAQARALSPEAQPGYHDQAVQLSPAGAPVQMSGDTLDAAEVTAITQKTNASLALNSWASVRTRVQGQIAAPIVKAADERKAGTKKDLTGIGSQVAAGRFAAEVKKLQGTWPKLTPWWRAQSLYKAANSELEKAKVPGFMLLRVKEMTARGGFASWEWGFYFQKAMLSAASLNDDDASELAQTTLHEARHAEQHFRIARLLAGEGKSAAEIKASDDMPGNIIQAALAKPLTDQNGSPEELAEAREWRQAMGPDGVKHAATSKDAGAQIDELKRLHGVATAALAAFGADPTRKNADAVGQARRGLEAQVPVVEKAYVAYRNIPYEKDANEVGVTANHACDQL